MAVNVILNGTFDAGSANWTGVDIETSFPENAYLSNGSSNRVSEIDGNRNATTVLEQSFSIATPITTELTFDVALRNASLGNAGTEGFTVEVLDSSGTAIAALTVLPTVNSFQPVTLPVNFATAGTYTLRFTEVGPDDSLGAIVDNIEIMVCLAAGSLIRVPDGHAPVEDLRIGDPVETAAGPKILRWIGRRHIPATELENSPHFAPVRITAGALGQGLPQNDLLVSRQHRICASSPVAERMFGAREILVAAIRLTALPGIFVDHTLDEVTYFHLLFDNHEIIFANGAPTESLWTGAEALAALGAHGREEVFALFPELRGGEHVRKTAHVIPPNKRQNRFVARLQKNARRPLG